MINQRQTIKDNIAKYNKPAPLADFLLPFTIDKRKVRIADIGSGAYSVIGSFYPGLEVQIIHADNQDFTKWYKKHNVTPVIEVQHQDMEKLTYPDNSFDIVTCINALDHTFNAEKALQELIRICKPGGYVYIDCCLEQLNTGHKHHWNADEQGVFDNFYESFDLKKYGFEIKLIDNGMERRYNHIIATLKKHD